MTKKKISYEEVAAKASIETLKDELTFLKRHEPYIHPLGILTHRHYIEVVEEELRSRENNA